MANTEKRIGKLEVMFKPEGQIRPNLVMLYENGEPINEYYAEVLRLNREAESGGEDVRLTVLRIPAQEL